MKGKVVRVIKEKMFGFIKSNGVDFFFHRDDFQGNWHELVGLIENGERPNVTFEEIASTKGPRAAGVDFI